MALQMPNEAVFGFWIQGDGTPTDTGFGTAETTNSDFKYFPMTDCGFGPVKNQDVLPPEIGGRALPGGAFATGAWAEGTLSIIPRLDNRLGWILLAVLGEVSTVLATTVEHFIAGTGGGSDTGINTHIFTFYSTDHHWVPYCTFRRWLPHTTAASSLGEVSQDGRFRSMTITAAGASPLTMDLDAIARLADTGQFDFGPDWDDSGEVTYDDLEDFGVTSCSGHFKVEGTSFEVTNVSITVTNQLLPPAQAMKIGSMHPIDYPVLGRVVTATATILVPDYNLYVSTFSGATNAGVDAETTCIVYKADLDAEFKSQTYITGTEPYILRVRSNLEQDNVAWQVRPIRVQPNRPVVLQVTASFLATAAGDPIEVLLQNGQTAYTVT